MTKLASANFDGANGTRYSFEVYSLDTAFQDVGAVYVMSQRNVEDGKGVHTIAYVGETGQLATRLSTHEKWECARGHGVNCICVHTESSSTVRLKIESDLVKGLNPPCNKQ